MTRSCTHDALRPLVAGAIAAAIGLAGAGVAHAGANSCNTLPRQRQAAREGRNERQTVNCGEDRDEPTQKDSFDPVVNCE